jgi:hypothetical protein
MELVKLKEQAQKDKEPVKVTKKILTEEELAMKKQLLAQYDYEVIELSDDDEAPKPVKPIRGPPPKPSPDSNLNPLIIIFILINNFSLI